MHQATAPALSKPPKPLQSSPNQERDELQAQPQKRKCIDQSQQESDGHCDNSQNSAHVEMTTPPSPSPPPPPSPPISLPHVRGIVIALCCHHRCNWQSFVSREFFFERGFTATDFHLITHMSSWGVCGVRPGSKLAEERHNIDGSALPSANPPPVQTTTASDASSADISSSNSGSSTITTLSSSSTMTSNTPTSSEQAPHVQANRDQFSLQKTGSSYIPHPKEAIGLKCKRLLDIARLRYLRGCGFTAKLVYYVVRSVSLENVLLVAVPQQEVVT